MGFTSAWSISCHEDSVIADLAPRTAAAVEADRTCPRARRRWAAWRRAPLPDHRTWWTGTPAEDEAIRSFQDLTRPGRHVDDLCEFPFVEGIWDRQPDQELMFVSVQRKAYPVSALFHAIGPERAALLPGWCGNFVLSAAEVRAALPAVERALGFAPGERERVQRQVWLDTELRESVLDGPLRAWRAAAQCGLGLCGLAFHVE
ncbi:hypothetical protein [Streptomyces xanthophaeus]|uniref:hypothetical protein n=1 Tax=Streptomyces xanthophaeus TaxID=67385 RepID=UPI0026477C4E|nr:hypothetical protein [Streptomyces xanthophaeus]WKD36351.1 hypothetical protein KO717_33375 [Streptomyces xanthophaeus]